MSIMYYDNHMLLIRFWASSRALKSLSFKNLRKKINPTWCFSARLFSIVLLPYSSISEEPMQPVILSRKLSRWSCKSLMLDTGASGRRAVHASWATWELIRRPRGGWGKWAVKLMIVAGSGHSCPWFLSAGDHCNAADYMWILSST